MDPIYFFKIPLDILLLIPAVLFFRRNRLVICGFTLAAIFFYITGDLMMNISFFYGLMVYTFGHLILLSGLIIVYDVDRKLALTGILMSLFVLANFLFVKLSYNYLYATSIIYSAIILSEAVAAYNGGKLLFLSALTFILSNILLIADYVCWHSEGIRIIYLFLYYLANALLVLSIRYQKASSEVELQP